MDPPFAGIIFASLLMALAALVKVEYRRAKSRRLKPKPEGYVRQSKP